MAAQDKPYIVDPAVRVKFSPQDSRPSVRYLVDQDYSSHAVCQEDSRPSVKKPDDEEPDVTGIMSTMASLPPAMVHFQELSSKAIKRSSSILDAVMTLIFMMNAARSSPDQNAVDEMERGTFNVARMFKALLHECDTLIHEVLQGGKQEVPGLRSVNAEWHDELGFLWSIKQKAPVSDALPDLDKLVIQPGG